MNFCIYGINYKSVDIASRERYFISNDVSDGILAKFKELSVLPIVILSTCNRTEFYFSENSDNFVDVLKSSSHYMIDMKFEKKEKLAAIKHLFKVTSGLESQILGENEILSQVKNAYYKSLNLGLTNKFFNLLFNRALKVGKDVRSKTKISCGNLSFASIVFNKIKRLFGNINNKNILLVGAGVISETILNYFSKNEIKLKIVSGKHYEKAVNLANIFNTEVIYFDKLKSAITTSDIIIVATSAPHFLINKNCIIKDGKTRIIFDLSVPRNVDPNIKDNKTILYNIDNLKEISDSNLQIRKNAVTEAEKIIEGQIEEINKIWKRELELEQGHHHWH